MKKLKKKARKLYVKIVKRLIKWYRADSRSQKYRHYQLARQGKLTRKKKQEILSGIFKFRLQNRLEGSQNLQ